MKRTPERSMKRSSLDGRLFVPELVARLHRDGNVVQLRSPSVGLWRPHLVAPDLVHGGVLLGELEVLGVLYRVFAPDDATGQIAPEASTGATRRAIPHPVGYGEPLMILEAQTLLAKTSSSATAKATTAAAAGLRFTAPLSGRFYARPAPDKPLFVQAGDSVSEGQTVGLLEVMKTFNRITYGGAGLPPTATIKRVLPSDGDDLNEGDVILELDPAP